MNKFWKWMEEKGYGCYDPLTDVSRLSGAEAFKEPAKQMLIGYMMEYIHETNMMPKSNTLSTGELYNFLVKAIEGEKP